MVSARIPMEFIDFGGNGNGESVAEFLKECRKPSTMYLKESRIKFGKLLHGVLLILCKTVGKMRTSPDKTRLDTMEMAMRVLELYLISADCRLPNLDLPTNHDIGLLSSDLRETLRTWTNNNSFENICFL